MINTVHANSSLEEKYEFLKAYIRSLGSVAVTYSSGVDSTFLLKVAHDELGNQAIAITAKSCSFPVREYREALDFCEKENILHYIAVTNELEVDGFAENPKDRCYICKKALFNKMIEVAREHGAAWVLEGSNLDDDGDYRPGKKAIAELQVLSPLHEACLYKSEIRELSRRLHLPTAEKPSYACLSSRFAYGERITKEKLEMVDKAEQFLMDHGFGQLRVRIHGKMARIEVEADQMEKLFMMRREVLSYLESLGFLYVTMDLAGYQMGSMNKVL